MRTSILSGILFTVLVMPAVSRGETVTIRQGLNGYAGTADTQLAEGNPGTALGAELEASIDALDGGGVSQALLRFDGIVGAGPNQIPSGAVITSATLHLTITSAGSGMNFHRMLMPWNEATITWNSATNGISADGVEALASASQSVGANDGSGNIPSGPFSVDLTADVQAWVNGQANNGWAILPFLPNGTNGADFVTKEGALVIATAAEAPTLSVTYTVPEPASMGLMAIGAAALMFRRRKA